jgi:hypothetical protein
MKNIIILSFLILSTAAFSSIDELKQDVEGLEKIKNEISESAQYFSDNDYEEVNGYRIRKLGKKFVGVFSNINKPLAVFDLSLNALNWKEVLIGAFKLRDFNLKGTIKNIYCARKIIKKNARREEGKKARMKFCEGNKKLDKEIMNWNEMRMTSSWAQRQSGSVAFSRGGFEFSHSDFNLSELVFDSEEEKDFFRAPYIELYKILNPEEENFTELIGEKFLSEFEFRFNKERQEYSLVWNREKRERKKKVKLPGVLVNYMSPVSPYAYRSRLMQIDSYADLLKFRWYPYGPIMATMIYRVVDKLIDRVNYHESQLIALMEAQQAFEYESRYPNYYLNTTLSLLYLPRSNPSHFGSGNDYRKLYRARLDENKKKILKEMRKEDEIALKNVGTGKFFIERQENHESGELEFKGIISTSNKPMWLTGLLSRHVSKVPNGLKNLERFAINTAGYLAKAFLRTWVSFRLGPINFSFSLPRDTWERLIRLRHQREIYLEGQLAGLLDEAIMGRYDLGLSKEEAIKARSYIAQNFMNPYETHIENEEDVISQNMKLLLEALKGEKLEKINAAHLLPMSL